jgi:hypothetical protein
MFLVVDSVVARWSAVSQLAEADGAMVLAALEQQFRAALRIINPSRASPFAVLVGEMLGSTGQAALPAYAQLR